MSHAHRRDPRLSTPSVDLCACGAIHVGEIEEWLETSWEPHPWVPPPAPPPTPPGRTTTPLPFVALDWLIEVCR